MYKKVLLVLLVLQVCIPIFTQQTIEELEKDGWIFDTHPDLDGINFFTKIPLTRLINNNDIYFDNPEDFHSALSSQFILSKQVFSTDGTIKYTNEEKYAYESGLLKEIQWKSDSISFTSTFNYDSNGRITLYSIYNNDKQSFNVYEKYTYYNNYIVISDFSNKIDKVIIANKTDFGYRVSIYQEKKKNTLIDFYLQNDNIVKIIRQLYVGAKPSSSQYNIEYQDNKITKMIRQSLANNRVIYEKYYKYENGLLIEVFDKSLNQLINLSSFTPEGNWCKKVVSRNGVKEAIFTRTF